MAKKKTSCNFNEVAHHAIMIVIGVGVDGCKAKFRSPSTIHEICEGIVQRAPYNILLQSILSLYVSFCKHVCFETFV